MDFGPEDATLLAQRLPNSIPNRRKSGWDRSEALVDASPSAIGAYQVLIARTNNGRLSAAIGAAERQDALGEYRRRREKSEPPFTGTERLVFECERYRGLLLSALKTACETGVFTEAAELAKIEELLTTIADT
jgi:hypothetical protein